MSAAVQNVQHRRGQQVALFSFDACIEGQAAISGRCARNREGYAQNGICSESRFVGSAIQGLQCLIKLALLACIHSANGGLDLSFNIRTCNQNALAAVSSFVPIPEFDGFMLARRSSGWNLGRCNRSTG